jgi:tetratricopeptide (TPR) repeat protein
MAAKNYARARELIEQKDFHPAVEMLREAIHFVPDNAEYRFCLGQVELQNENWIERGLQNLMDAARLEPKRQYLVAAAQALHQYGRQEDALLFARRAAYLEPSPENQQLLNLVLGRSEKPAGTASRLESPAAPESRLDDQESRKAAEKARSGFLSRLFRRRA